MVDFAVQMTTLHLQELFHELVLNNEKFYEESYLQVFHACIRLDVCLRQRLDLKTGRTHDEFAF